MTVVGRFLFDDDFGPAAKQAAPAIRSNASASRRSASVRACASAAFTPAR